MFTEKWKYGGKDQIQIIKAILQLGLVKKRKIRRRKQQLFLGHPKWWSCRAWYRKQLLCMPCRVVSCSNFPCPLQPLPTMLSYVTSVMLRALLSWLESRDCFQACISHLAAHDAAGGQSAVSLFCQTSELVSDTESRNKNRESET